MAYLPETTRFDDVYQLEATDPLLGYYDGVLGELNWAAQALTNRTAYLKQQVVQLAVADAAALRLVDLVAGIQVAQTFGALAAGDGGGGLWRWDKASTDPDNTGTVLLPTGHSGAGRWLRLSNGNAVNVRWFGAKGTGLPGDDDTDAINAALARPSQSWGIGRSVYLPAGKYRVRTLNVPSWTELRGDGWNSKIIPTTGYDAMQIDHSTNVTLRDFAIYGNGVSNSGRGIYFNGSIEIKLSDVYVWYMGSHGIEFYDATGATSGSYPVRAIRVSCLSNGGDGYRQMSSAPDGHQNQQNAVHLADSSFSGNALNGLSLWGQHIVVDNSTIESNGGYGLALKTNGVSSQDGASSISIIHNYFENNTTGQLYVNTEIASIAQLTITGNRIVHNNKSISYIPVKFKNSSVYPANLRIKGLYFCSNQFIVTSGTSPAVLADFDNALWDDCYVKPMGLRLGSMSSDFEQSFFAEYDKYINLGSAKIDSPRSIILNGYVKSSGDILFSDYDKSDHIAVGTHTLMMPLALPHNSQIVGVTLSGETDTTFSVTAEIMARSYASAAPYVSIGSITRSLFKGGYYFTDGEQVFIKSINGTANNATGTAIVSSGSSISGVTITSGGTGYINNELIMIGATDNTGGYAVVGIVSVAAGGIITAVEITGYTYAIFPFTVDSAFKTRATKHNIDQLLKLTVVNSAASVAKLGSATVWYV